MQGPKSTYRPAAAYEQRATIGQIFMLGVALIRYVRAANSTNSSGIDPAPESSPVVTTTQIIIAVLGVVGLIACLRYCLSRNNNKPEANPVAAPAPKAGAPKRPVVAIIEQRQEPNNLQAGAELASGDGESDSVEMTVEAGEEEDDLPPPAIAGAATAEAVTSTTGLGLEEPEGQSTKVGLRNALSPPVNETNIWLEEDEELETATNTAAAVAADLTPLRSSPAPALAGADAAAGVVDASPPIVAPPPPMLNVPTPRATPPIPNAPTPRGTPPMVVSAVIAQGLHRPRRDISNSREAGPSQASQSNSRVCSVSTDSCAMS